jgi:modulator of FtsH protease
MKEVYADNIQSNSTNQVLQQTYRLLSMTIGFAGVTALASMVINFSLNPIIFLVAYFGVLFMVSKNKNNKSGIAWTFVLTGLLGFTLGPMLNMYIAAGLGGLIATSLLGTGLIFLICAQIGKNSEKDFSSIGKFAGIGILIAFVCGLLNLFIFQATIFSVIISGAFMVLSSLIITWQINSIVRGGETNYVMATVTLFVSLYNIFTSLLHLLGYGSSD